MADREHDIGVLDRALSDETDRHFNALDRAEAAEARVVELAGALKWFDIHADSLAADLRSAHHSRGEGGSQWMADDDRELRANFRKAIECTRTVLAGTLAEALERARAVRVHSIALRKFARNSLSSSAIH
ncbi:MAG TPA: hypothetical protein ENI13_00205 [candidate division CPR3 bacterium]|uniref:Uncharacterized protein n=1 Tax=candidate division CPR3 bacterium TaxID=2268181 RepID=A0A7C1NXJ3_UNCC3|nr:hypothetical protein [candidate division CPR3 bacterium]